MEIGSALTDLNDWWLDGSISDSLAKSYRRHAFAEFRRLFDAYREVLVITGLRRVGKTTIIYQQISDLLKEHAPREILYFTFDYGAVPITDILDAYRKLTDVDWKHQKFFLFLDEVQKLAGWSSQVKMLYDSFPNIKIVVSGSASLELEKGAADNLAGRHFLVGIKPLSLIEFYELKHERHIERPALFRDELDAEVDAYITKPFPETVKWRSYRDVAAYVRENVVSKIVRSDLPDSFKGVNFFLLEKMLDVFYSNPGMLLSVDENVKAFGVSKTTFENHLFFLDFAKLIRIVGNFRGSTVAASRKGKKVYPYDISLALAFNPDIGAGSILETKVASVLAAKAYWRHADAEVDFVVSDRHRKVGVEVKASKNFSKSDLSGLHRLSDRFGMREVLIYRGNTGRSGRVRLINFTDFLIKEGL
ncbi:ATP-binding protein [Candidatus Marsarchaeota archaeon]|jgi:predicted AAA+ superfamily ATPase|nr:ATP-binding protein [Candidatus Marsarchaeota archaeon]MCL5099859.1 ATP-binding protein [Candidatus Marsarchaeota archaeon]